MKVLYVHDRLGAFAGAEANAFITATELAKRGHTLGLLHGPPTGRDQQAWQQTFPSRFAWDPAQPRQCTRAALSSFAPDVVYVHNLAELEILEGLVDSGLPLVRMVHDHALYCLRSYRYNVFTRRICTQPASARCIFPCLATIARNRGPGLPLRWASYPAKRREMALNQRFHRILAVSDFMRGELVSNGFDPRRIEIHPPVPRPVPDAPRSSFSDRNLIVFAGQIVRGKGVDVLLQALARVRCHFECVILGEGHHRPHCERLARRLGLTDRVRFAGFVSRDALTSFYRDCSVVVVPSVWPEPIATIGLEVMQFGLPVVGFDAGGIRDWLEDGYNGYLVPWMDRTAFAACLERLLNDKALASRLGENGRGLARERYDFSAYIAGLEALLQRVVQEAR